MNNKSYLEKYGAIYVFTLIIVYIASSIYNNLGRDYLTELLNNNLQYSVAADEDLKTSNFICSIKNTGYSAANDIKILIWSTTPEFRNIDYDSSVIQPVYREDKDYFIHSVFKMNSNIYPGEIKTVKILLNKVDIVKSDFGKEKKGTVKVRVYSSNAPAIFAPQITEKTNFAIGPYLRDLLWAIAWSYISIGLFIVLPLAVFIFLVFYLLTRLLNIKVV